MALEFKCQNCNETIVTNLLIGNTVKCPSCGSENIIPETAVGSEQIQPENTEIPETTEQGLVDRLEMLADEEKITELRGSGIVLRLTSKRLAYTAVVERGRETGAAMIKDVDSVKIRTTRPSLALIIFGAILAIGSIAVAKDLGRYWIPPFLLGVGLIALFFLLRKKVVQFTVAGAGWLVFSTSKIGSEKSLLSFINKFFKTKNGISIT